MSPKFGIANLSRGLVSRLGARFHHHVPGNCTLPQFLRSGLEALPHGPRPATRLSRPLKEFVDFLENKKLRSGEAQTGPRLATSEQPESLWLIKASLP
jgi:hypothetical protein